MKAGRSMLFLAAILVFCITVVTSTQSQRAGSSTVKLGDKVIVIPKNGAVMFDPDNPRMKSLMEKISRQLSEAASKQIEYEVNDSKYLGEFDVRPDVYSGMIFFMYTKDVKGIKSTTAGVGSMTFLKVGPRIININVYRNLSSPAAVETELQTSGYRSEAIHYEMG